MMRTPGAFYRREGEVFVPTGLGLSPWDKRSQNGVSLAGLIAYSLESVPTRTPMLTARITLDIMGAVPMEALTPVVRILRDGPRIQLVEVELRIAGRIWVRATALRARLDESPAASTPLPRVFPADATGLKAGAWLEVLRVTDDSLPQGHLPMWVRFTCEVVEGQPLTPLQRAALIADFGAGVAPLLNFREWTSANLDITLHLARLPKFEWLLIEGVSESGGNGIGLSTARIGDADGLFATSLQTSFLNRISLPRSAAESNVSSQQQASAARSEVD
jgi:hypothetical protein